MKILWEVKQEKTRKKQRLRVYTRQIKTRRTKLNQKKKNSRGNFRQQKGLEKKRKKWKQVGRWKKKNMDAGYESFNHPFFQLLFFYISCFVWGTEKEKWKEKKRESREKWDEENIKEKNI